MEYIYAALLLHNAGKAITEEAISAVLKAAGIEVNEARAKALLQPLKAWTSKKLSQRQHSQPLQQQPHLQQPHPQQQKLLLKKKRKKKTPLKKTEWPVSAPSSDNFNIFGSPQGGLCFFSNTNIIKIVGDL